MLLPEPAVFGSTQIIILASHWFVNTFLQVFSHFCDFSEKRGRAAARPLGYISGIRCRRPSEGPDGRFHAMFPR